MATTHDSLAAASYALVVATLLDMAENGRLEEAERIADMADRVLGNLVKEGTLTEAAREDAQAAVDVFRKHVSAAEQLR